MLLWALCLKLWWLWLPLSTLAHPSSRSTDGKRATSENLELRNAEPLDDPETLKAAAPNGRLFQIAPLLIYADGSRPPPPGDAPATKETILNPVWMRYDGPGVLNMTSAPGDKVVPFDWEYPPYTDKKLIVCLSPVQCGIYVEKRKTNARLGGSWIYRYRHNRSGRQY